MDLERIRDICLGLNGVTEEMPFGEDTLVYKVMNKMFLATSLRELEVNFVVKCDPERALELRERYADIQPGFHMNKKHWNTVYCQRELSDPLILEQIIHSYEMVVKTLKKEEREEIGNME